VSWTIDVPYRTRDDGLVDVAFAGRALPDPESRAVLRELVLEATVAGDRTAGDLFDRLAKITPAERRHLLDRMRERAGLESTADVEATRKFEAANAALIKRRVKNMGEPAADETPRLSNGAIVMLDAAEVERERRRDAQREASSSRGQREREAEAEAVRRARERYVERNIDDPIAFPPIAGFPQSRIRSA
jgi:hypothetical protein